MKNFIKILKLGYRGLLTHILRNRPDAVDLFITTRCNLRCINCDLWKIDMQDKELETEQWKKVILELKKWLGTIRLRICGGEPLIRRDLFEIIDYANSLDFFTILSTNGTLINEKSTDRIIKSGLNYISISLDSINGERYDTMRGVPGTFEKTLKAIHYIKEKMGTLQIMTTIMEKNIDEIIDIVRLCEDMGIWVSFQGLYEFYENRNELPNMPESQLWPKNKQKLKKVFSEILLKKKTSYCIIDPYGYLESLRDYYLNYYDYMSKIYKCRAYQKNFFITFNGDVIYCRTSGNIGNVLRDDPQKIWNSQQAKLVRDDMKNCKKNCSHIRCMYNETLKEKIRKFSDVILSKRILKS